jgi:hypothetical protein
MDNNNLIVPLPSFLAKAAESQLLEDDTVSVQLKGAFQEALICTESRVLIVKRGFMTGHIFGRDVFQLPYVNIAGAQVNRHLLTGYFEVSAGGMQNTPKSYWQTGKSGPEHAPNCISLNRPLFRKFEAAANFIMERVQIASGLGQPARGGTASPIELLEKLAALHKNGVLTDAEFAQKKTEILANMT